MNTNKTLYGLLAFAPMVLIIIGVILLFGLMVTTPMLDDGNPPQESVFLMLASFAMLGIGGLLSTISMIMYLIHVSKNQALPDDQRILWILGIVFLNGIIQIVYFFVHITKEGEIPPIQTEKSPWD